MADYKMDKIDLKILKMLQENSKITNLDLSKRIGLSPAPTLERVKKLEQSGIIQSYHAKVDSSAIGLNADFLLKIVCKDIPTYEKMLFKTLSQIEEIERLKTLMTLSKVKKEKVLPFDYENAED